MGSGQQSFGFLVLELGCWPFQLAHWQWGWVLLEWRGVDPMYLLCQWFHLCPVEPHQRDWTGQDSSSSLFISQPFFKIIPINCNQHTWLIFHLLFTWVILLSFMLDFLFQFSVISVDSPAIWLGNTSWPVCTSVWTTTSLEAPGWSCVDSLELVFGNWICNKIQIYRHFLFGWVCHFMTAFWSKLCQSRMRTFKKTPKKTITYTINNYNNSYYQ